MTFNLRWVIKEKADFPLPKDPVKACPYFRKTAPPEAHSLASRCLAWTGFYSRFSTAQGMEERYCKENFSACPLYKAAAGGTVGEYQSDKAEAWPLFTP